MAHAIKLTAVTVVLLLCSALSDSNDAAKPDYTKIEKEIKKTFAEITKAAESVDANALFSYVLDNDKGSLIQRGRIVLTRKEAFESYKRNSEGIEEVKYEIDPIYVTVISSETAIVVAEGSFEATTIDGRTFGRDFAQTVVFVLKDNKWKVLHAHTSSPFAGQ